MSPDVVFIPIRAVFLVEPLPPDNLALFSHYVTISGQYNLKSILSQASAKLAASTLFLWFPSLLELVNKVIKRSFDTVFSILELTVL